MRDQLDRRERPGRKTGDCGIEVAQTEEGESIERLPLKAPLGEEGVGRLADSSTLAGECRTETRRDSFVRGMT